MTWFVSLASRLVQRVPVAVLLVLVAATVVLGTFASEQRVETDITEFAPEGELTDLFDRIEEDFGAREGQLQVIVDAGPGGNVLDRDGLRTAERVTELAEETDPVGDALREGGPMGGAVNSYASPVIGQLGALDAELEDVGQGFLDAVLDDVFTGEQAAQIEGLLSNDFDGERARGGLVAVALHPDLSQDETEAASLALQDALEREDFGFLDVSIFSFAILAQDLESGFEEELPVLLGISFLLIIGILGVLYRRVSDVLLAVTGLVVSIVWMAGFSVLLGPDYLGITGPFNQIAIAVPVLLVGLGVDYSVHLSARYREERASGGRNPADAAGIAVATVGVALLLATVTTVIGFLSNAISPLPPIADFGWFAAAGILSSFIVLGGLVPAARNLLDRRRGAATPAPETGGGPLITRLAEIPARAPVLALVAGVLAAAGGGLLATNLDTTFSQDEFIPEDSDAGRLLDQLDDLFGGDVSEQTFVVLDGDVEDVDALQAMYDAEEELAELDDVVAVDGRAEVQSPPQVIANLDEIVDGLRQQLAAQFALLDDPDGAADNLPLPDAITVDDLPPDVREELEAGDDLALGDDADVLPVDDLDALEERLPEGVSPFEALLAALPDADLVQMFRAGIAEQLEDDAPDVDPEIVADLAAREPEELTADVIRESGYPLDELPDDTLELLEAGDRLEALGWTGDGFAPDADVPGLLAVVDEHSGDELRAVVGDGTALMIVSTRAGEERAAELAGGLRDQLAAVEAAGVAATVVSEPLLIDETLTSLADSQTNAIIVSLAAALALLTLYYTFSARRPALGFITMIPALLSVPLILGSMWLAGLSFNALTATVAAIAIGIGVPYGIHLTNRYLEQRRRGGDPAETVRTTIRHTGAALFGSAVTTASGFGVLVLSGLMPIRQFGGVTSVTILFALVTALFVESSALVLWDRFHRRRGDLAPAPRKPHSAALAGDGEVRRPAPVPVVVRTPARRAQGEAGR